MSDSRASAGTHPDGATAYTVIRKSGQRGMEFTDPRLAAKAFLEARGQDQPFVLRHRGSATSVIVSTRPGVRRIVWNMLDESFIEAYDALENEGVAAVLDSNLLA